MLDLNFWNHYMLKFSASVLFMPLVQDLLDGYIS